MQIALPTRRDSLGNAPRRHPRRRARLLDARVRHLRRAAAAAPRRLVAHQRAGGNGGRHVLPRVRRLGVVVDGAHRSRRRPEGVRGGQPRCRGGKRRVRLLRARVGERDLLPGPARDRHRRDVHAGLASAFGPRRRAEAEPRHRLLHGLVRTGHRPVARPGRRGREASRLARRLPRRVGRRRWILLAMAFSGTSGILLGLSAPWHWAIVSALLAAYSMLVMADSATLTAGLVAAAPRELRGSAMGVYSLAGFGGGMIGPIVFGAALDAAGGASRPLAWVVGYASIGLGCLAAPLVASRMGRRSSVQPRPG